MPWAKRHEDRLWLALSQLRDLQHNLYQIDQFELRAPWITQTEKLENDLLIAARTAKVSEE
jgi:hypothetical protein